MTSPLDDRAEAVRRFNRFYTQQVGALNEHLLHSAFSLTESRVLYELSAATDVTLAGLCQALGLDAGYLSRMVSAFEKNGLITKARSDSDGRVTHLQLSAAGRSVVASLELAAREEVAQMLEQLPEGQQAQLVQAMQQVQALLGRRTADYLLRAPRPGDMGQVVQQQAELYAREYGWNSEFEALVAQIVSEYLRDYDPASDHCWIAEKNGKAIGSVFVVRHDATTAKLRMLYVDASARGLGIGNRLIDEALRFARQAGYARMILWTTSVLTDARRLYQKAGFELVEEEPVHSFGKDLVSQTWALRL
ncbi:helix-turn-helix domain-containing GNAT family N-acetyltransferase [Pseudomonas fakonensis]|uniref:Helix-turn-helix domain-containing GNAT family N-acetyltransferase n=1 Tax=Pseudomonas fakonensis TaxID=2842355 RepID=A0ABX8NA38_9PSED|nr:helix-turn-helix domain-containing GNAT family N-acetyltransferase [Pseudomonas fakonensis]QXH53224.1 helix-turn-helix domain-containing GNAT family N-acetyltransferase [Pseudomonas fakonensis]